MLEQIAVQSGYAVSFCNQHRHHHCADIPFVASQQNSHCLNSPKTPVINQKLATNSLLAPSDYFPLAACPGLGVEVAETIVGPLPFFFHSCQGAFPLLCRSSSSCFSLNVSMLFQKPSYSYPTRSCASISLRKGSCTSSSP